MFQVQRLGGAKRDIPSTLPAIATEDWVPFAHAMTGFQQQAPQCSQHMLVWVAEQRVHGMLP